MTLCITAPSMAVPSIAFQPYAAHFHLRPSLCSLKFRARALAAVDTINEEQGVAEYSSNGSFVGNDPSKWKRLNLEELGITQSMISVPAKRVLGTLKEKGYQVYLAGGCVRDLILKLEPHIFHVLTSAEIEEVVRTFSSVLTVGKLVKVCRVYLHDSYVEVSSFSNDEIRFNAVSRSMPKRPADSDVNDFIRWKNCLLRDFTVNGLIFDPYTNIIYDYVGGMEDIKMAKMQTIIPPSIYFQEDCACILRGIKLAASLGFSFPRETTWSLKNLSSLISGLKQTNRRMELNLMLSHGSAEASLRSGLLAFHKALYDQPRDPLVVAAFSLAVHSGGDVSEAVKVAKQISLPHDSSFPELLEPRNLNSKALANEVMDLAASVEDALQKMADKSLGRVPIEPKLQEGVSRIFKCVGEGT